MCQPGVARPFWERNPHGAHHQAGQLLAEAANQPGQPEVQVRGEKRSIAENHKKKQIIK